MSEEKPDCLPQPKSAMKKEDFKPDEVYLARVCGQCILGIGGECHTPGCSFWFRQGPAEELIFAFIEPIAVDYVDK